MGLASLLKLYDGVASWVGERGVKVQVQVQVRCIIGNREVEWVSSDMRDATKSGTSRRHLRPPNINVRLYSSMQQTGHGEVGTSLTLGRDCGRDSCRVRGDHEQ